MEQKISAETMESGEINLQNFKHGDKYLTRNNKTAVLWRKWYDVNHKTQFFVYGEIGKATVGVKTGIWDENGKCVYNDKQMELQNDPTLDLVEKIEKKRQK